MDPRLQHSNGNGEGTGGLQVEAQEPQQQQQEYPAVFISNLTWYTTDVQLEHLCSEYGKVLGIRFIEDKSCGKSRGMCVVDLDSQEAVQQCIDSMNGMTIDGRQVRVNRQYAKYQGQGQQGGPPPHAGMGGGMGRGGMGPPGGGMPGMMMPSFGQQQQMPPRPPRLG
jgi:hypothetical protein